MRVLFIGRAKNGKISPITYAQGQSLVKNGIELSYYLIEGSGPFSYLKSLLYLLGNRKKFRSYDIFHAHYSLSAYVATLALMRPIVVSLMGSDVHGKSYVRWINKLFSKLFWNRTIVKSERMKSRLGYDKSVVIPNGVALEIFKPIDRMESRKAVGIKNYTDKIAVFIANPSRYEKNFDLAQKSINHYNTLNPQKRIVLISINNADHSEIPSFINAANIVLLTSRWEGSPNIIKEAMACNIPVVSTDVGDVREVIKNTDGCYVTDPDYKMIAGSLEKAVQHDRTNGREKVMHLDSKIIAELLVKTYSEVIHGK
jgi:teichuronic acid biosynthesis glycosyltransferase TuaC